jgi:SAM-dependent methyltransferase
VTSGLATTTRPSPRPRAEQAAPSAFGAGGAEPYARALRSDATRLFLHDTSDAGDPRVLDVARWSADADETDLTLLSAVTGPLLDVGCGPGRMVRAALALDIVALGLDISAAAIEVARSVGLPVVHRSVFDAVPRAGRWQTVLLVDGNIGIGGDVAALLARCTELATPDGEIVVETHPDPHRDARFTGRLADADGHVSAEFPWAEIGVRPLEALAARLGLELRQSWVIGDRGFARLAATTT